MKHLFLLLFATATLQAAITWPTIEGGVTFGNANEATHTWTWNLSTGTDPVITITDGVLNVSTGAFQVGGVAVALVSDIASHNTTTTNPGVSNDNTEGYVEGRSTWYNSTTKTLYLMLEDDTDEANWVALSGEGAIGVTGNSQTWTGENNFTEFHSTGVMDFNSTSITYQAGVDTMHRTALGFELGTADADILLYDTVTGKFEAVQMTGDGALTKAGVFSVPSAIPFVVPGEDSIVKYNFTTGEMEAAVAGTDYVAPGGALGTPSSGTLTNATGLPIASGVSGLGTGIATALAINAGSAGAPALLNGALGTPSSGSLGMGAITLTGTMAQFDTAATDGNFVWQSGLGTGVATALATPSSANLRAALTDESGTGAAVFQGGDLGASTATTPSAGDNDTSLATTAFVQTEVDTTLTATHASPSVTTPLAPTWNGPTHVVWYGATGEIDLPAAAGYTGRGIIVYNTGAFTVTIDPNGAEVIVRDGTVQTGGVSFTLASGSGNFVALVSDGVRWITLGVKGSLAEGS